MKRRVEVWKCCCFTAENMRIGGYAEAFCESVASHVAKMKDAPGAIIT